MWAVFPDKPFCLPFRLLDVVNDRANNVANAELLAEKITVKDLFSSLGVIAVICNGDDGFEC